MTIEEAIEHCKETAMENRRSALNFARGYIYDAAQNCQECAAEHEQLAEWLTELKQRREAENQQDAKRDDMSMNRKSMIKPYKKCKKCGAFIVSGDLCEECKPMTNADRIRAMTDEELRQFLNDIADKCSMHDCNYCPMNGACDDVPISMQKWLKQEVSEDAGTD